MRTTRSTGWLVVSMCLAASAFGGVSCSSSGGGSSDGSSDDPSSPFGPGWGDDDPGITPGSGTQAAPKGTPGPKGMPGAPKAISGGTLLVTRGSGLAVASDQDRDQLWITDLDAQVVVGEVALKPGDEPGRLAEDAAGRVHVALRRGGAVVTIDPVSATILARREVCAAPRGVAYDYGSDALLVACQGGELITLPAAGGEPTSRLQLDDDLRDVVAGEGGLFYVSRFRSAELLIVGLEGKFIQRRQPPSFKTPFFDSEFTPSVAWRTFGIPGGKVVMLHQRGSMKKIKPKPDGYKDDECDGAIVHSAMTVFHAQSNEKGPTELVAAQGIPAAALPVDAALAPDGSRFAMIAAGSHKVFVYDPQSLEVAGDKNCKFTGLYEPAQLPWQPISVAYSQKGQLVAQLASPAGLVLLNETGGIAKAIPFNVPSADGTGHAMFHEPPSPETGLACASCHPEGHEDGRTWFFDAGLNVPPLARRTQNLGVGGGVSQTAPFHWSGDLSTMDILIDEVFVSRMGGSKPTEANKQRMGQWIDTLSRPVASPRADGAAIARGKELFESVEVGCSGCHFGPQLTSPGSYDVGTGELLQVPSLVGIGTRAPYIHNGCAATLHDRFTNPYCGGGDKHGTTSQLDAQQIDDLVAYLQSL